MPKRNEYDEIMLDIYTAIRFDIQKLNFNHSITKMDIYIVLWTTLSDFIFGVSLKARVNSD